MPRRLLLLNGAFVIVSALCVLYIGRQLMAPMPLPTAPRSRPAPAAPPSGQVEASRAPAAAYTVVSARNLFSPTRSEAPATGVAGGAAPPMVKPNLYGVVLRDGAPIAYMEDPATKRVAGYRVGDSITGGTLKTISADSVVIARPDGQVDVRLRDPGKPRPAATAGAERAPGAIPGVPAVAGAHPPAPSALPGVIPPVQPAAPPAAATLQPPSTSAGAPYIPGRRVLPPNLLRRLPQAPLSEPPQQ